MREREKRKRAFTRVYREKGDGIDLQLFFRLSFCYNICG